jgi:hypothetical protein
LTLKILYTRQEVNAKRPQQGQTGLTEIYPSIWQLDWVLMNVQVDLAISSVSTRSNKGEIQGIPGQQMKIIN